MSCICLGPKGSGKTHLLKSLQDPSSIDDTSYSPPTIGVSYYNIDNIYLNAGESVLSSKSIHELNNNNDRNKNQKKANSFQIMEIGGTMAPIWRQYFHDVKKLIYVVDTSNLCQISAAGVLLYSILTEPRLQKAKVLLVLTKMDYAYRQMRNEALLMLQISKLEKQIPQKVTVAETSSITKMGLSSIYQWLQSP